MVLHGATERGTGNTEKRTGKLTEGEYVIRLNRLRRDHRRQKIVKGMEGGRWVPGGGRCAGKQGTESEGYGTLRRGQTTLW